MACGKHSRSEFCWRPRLAGEANVWLSHLVIDARIEFDEPYINRIRAIRDSAHKEMVPRFERWPSRKDQSFYDFVSGHTTGFAQFHKKQLIGLVENWKGDPAEELLSRLLLQGSSALIALYFYICCDTDIQRGDRFNVMLKFLSWPELAMLPCNRISAYMYAALARKLASGQKLYPTRGIVNDITMLAAYMPYVLAMFVDNGCASSLREAPLSKDLTYKARIFSLKTGDAFLTYIEELIENAPEEVLQAAKEVCGGP